MHHPQAVQDVEAATAEADVEAATAEAAVEAAPLQKEYKISGTLQSYDESFFNHMSLDNRYGKQVQTIGSVAGFGPAVADTLEVNGTVAYFSRIQMSSTQPTWTAAACISSFFNQRKYAAKHIDAMVLYDFPQNRAGGACCVETVRFTHSPTVPYLGTVTV